jgi:hypothetical protein
MALPSFRPPRIPMLGQPRVPTQEPPRVVSPSPPTPPSTTSASPLWSLPPKPAGSIHLVPTPVRPPFQATPCRLNFTGAPSPRVEFSPQLQAPIPPPSLPTHEPISHHTRARAPAPTPLALFTTSRPLHERVKYQMPTTKTIRSPVEPVGFAGLCRTMPPTEVAGFAGLCQSLSTLDIPVALSVLDPFTGKFLEHRQLRWDPCYKATWDMSYANELGRLCQGVGSGATPDSKWVAGTNTFFIIDYCDIPAHKQKEICHTMVVCEVRPDKDDPDHTRITIGDNCICFLGDVSTNTASLELFKFLLNGVSCKSIFLRVPPNLPYPAVWRTPKNTPQNQPHHQRLPPPSIFGRFPNLE